MISAFYADDRQRYCWLSNFFVRPQWRHRGIGTRLYERLEKRLGDCSLQLMSNVKHLEPIEEIEAPELFLRASTRHMSLNISDPRALRQLRRELTRAETCTGNHLAGAPPVGATKQSGSRRRMSCDVQPAHVSCLAARGGDSAVCLSKGLCLVFDNPVRAFYERHGYERLEHWGKVGFQGAAIY